MQVMKPDFLKIYVLCPQIFKFSSLWVYSNNDSPIVDNIRSKGLKKAMFLQYGIAMFVKFLQEIST